MPITILVVDDERSGRETVELILEGQGYQLEFAENGIQAIEKARQVHPDVILLDVMMPGMTGFETCREIRKDSALAEIPVIFVTALDDEQSMKSGVNAGADEYITKPYDPHKLRAQLIGITHVNRHLLP